MWGLSALGRQTPVEVLILSERLSTDNILLRQPAGARGGPLSSLLRSVPVLAGGGGRSSGIACWAVADRRFTEPMTRLGR